MEGDAIILYVYLQSQNSIERIPLTFQPYFKETLRTKDTGIPGLFYVKIDQFNKTTGHDFQRLLGYFIRNKANKLVIDLRGNGGGPPLAARHIASYLLPPATELFYFKRKNRKKIMLHTFPSPIQFTGRLALLIDNKTGSASELFAGTMQSLQRAFVAGSPSAGKTFLKSLYTFSDGSLLMLVTSPAYMYNGTRYNTSGIQPNYTLNEDDRLFKQLNDFFEIFYEE